MKDFIIYGKLVPCTEFIDSKGLTEEKKKELWVKVLSNDPIVQDWIEKNVWFTKTRPYRLYKILTADPTLRIYGYYKNNKGLDINIEHIEFNERG